MSACFSNPTYNNIRGELQQYTTSNYDDLFGKTSEYWARIVNTEIARIISTDDANSDVLTEIECDGVKRLYDVIRNFKACRQTWEIYQVRLFSETLCAVLPLILGADADSCIDYIRQKYKWTSTAEELFCTMPRGAGKSTAVVKYIPTADDDACRSYRIENQNTGDIWVSFKFIRVPGLCTYTNCWQRRIFMLTSVRGMETV